MSSTFPVSAKTAAWYRAHGGRYQVERTYDRDGAPLLSVVDRADPTFDGIQCSAARNWQQNREWLQSECDRLNTEDVAQAQQEHDDAR